MSSAETAVRVRLSRRGVVRGLVLALAAAPGLSACSGGFQPLYGPTASGVGLQERLAQLDVAAIPGEIYPELVLDQVQYPVDPGADFPDAPIELAIYKQLRGPHRIIVGLAGDEIGYIIPKRQWDVKPPFCYGRKKDQYGEENSLGPNTAPLLCQAFKDLVNGKK